MKLLLKTLMLAFILPYQAMAMERPGSPLYPVLASSSSSSSSSSPVFPNQSPIIANVDWPTRIDKITLQLKPIEPTPIDTAYISKYSKLSAISAAAFGAAVTSACLQKYNKHLSFIQKAGVSLGIATASGALAYFGTHKFFTNRATTQARINHQIRNDQAQADLAEDQKTINKYIDEYNDVYGVYENADLNRMMLQAHLNDASIPDNRLAIYGLAYHDLDDKSSPISRTIEYYLERKASSIYSEEDALKKVKTDVPQFKNSYSHETEANLEDILKKILHYYDMIDQANKTLPEATIWAWIETVKTLPEYKAEKLFDDLFHKTYVKLSSLQTLTYFDFKSLPKHPDNDRYAAYFIDEIRGKMQKYYDTVATLNKQIADYNEQVQQTPKPILEFIAHYKSKTNQLFDQFIPFHKLSEYERFLAKDCNEKEREEWLNTCFPEESKKFSADNDDILTGYNSANEYKTDRQSDEDENGERAFWSE